MIGCSLVRAPKSPSARRLSERRPRDPSAVTDLNRLSRSWTPSCFKIRGLLALVVIGRTWGCVGLMGLCPGALVPSRSDAIGRLYSCWFLRRWSTCWRGGEQCGEQPLPPPLRPAGLSSKAGSMCQWDRGSASPPPSRLPFPCPRRGDSWRPSDAIANAFSWAACVSRCAPQERERERGSGLGTSLTGSVIGVVPSETEQEATTAMKTDSRGVGR